MKLFDVRHDVRKYEEKLLVIIRTTAYHPIPGADARRKKRTVGTMLFLWQKSTHSCVDLMPPMRLPATDLPPPT
jgi:hypothetical protein